MADLVFTSDLVIASPSENGEKATIRLNERGDLQTSDGQNKLSFQLMRAISNEETVRKLILNSPVAKRHIQTMLNLVLRDFKQIQVETINNQDANFSGYSIFRLQSGTNATYEKVSTNYVQYRFTDTNLFNGQEYRYAVKKAFNNIFESDFTESFAITPNSSLSKQDVYIGKDVIAFAGDKQVQFYVIYNKKFKSVEILDDIISMEIAADTVDPRRVFVNVVVKAYNGTQIAIASTRRKAST